MTIRGFTLIELVIVIAIIGILAAVAYSGYSAQTTAARREDAKTALMGLAQAMERNFTTTNDYTQAIGGGNGPAAPTIFAVQSPVSGGFKHYDLEVTVDPAAGTYTLQAIPSVDSPQYGDGFLQLESSGLRGWDRNDSTTIDAGEQCWEKTC